MKNKLQILLLILPLLIVSCGKPNILHIMPSEEVASMQINEIIENEELTTDEKSYLLQIKLSEDIERKKKAVDLEKDNKLSAVINRPVTPLRTNDTILRVLILPYEDESGVLNSWKFSFIKVDNGRWVISDYLNSSETSSKKTLTPLRK